MDIVWIVAIIAFGVFEGVTAQLVSVWFVLGSVAGLIASLLGADLPLQIAIFAAVSLIALVLTRPLVNKYVKSKAEKTNADRCIGQNAVVLEEIDNLQSKGQVKTDGKVWTARSASGEIIPKDTIVTVEKIEGVKVIVSPKL